MVMLVLGTGFRCHGSTSFPSPECTSCLLNLARVTLVTVLDACWLCEFGIKVMELSFDVYGVQGHGRRYGSGNGNGFVSPRRRNPG